MKYILTFGLAWACTLVYSQTTVGLVAYYAFDTGTQDGTGNSANTGTEIGDPSYSCGAQGSAIFLDGGDDAVVVLGNNNINNEFDTEDFSISFYFKPVGDSGTQYLISKRSADCGDENIFYIRYAPATRTINAALIQDPLKGVSLVHTINNTACWQHVVLVRDDRRLKMYINTELVAEYGTASRVDILNDGNLTIGNSSCLGGTEVPYDGLIDELRVYNRALSESEIKTLELGPDRILTRDTLLFLGRWLDITTTQSCATLFEWTPASNDLQPSNSADPTLTPSAAGMYVYTVRFADNVSTCVASDSIHVNVVDPATLICDTLYLPKAFTPNGDGTNDTYGISNPFAVQQLVSFEIFDRWEGRVFYSENAFGQWDGTFRGKAVNPGVLLYKITHICNGVERFASGSLTLLR